MGRLGRLLLGGIGLGRLPGLCLHLLGVARSLAQAGQLAGVHQVDGDRLGIGQPQFTLRLDGEKGPCQKRCVQKDGGRQSAAHCRSRLETFRSPPISVTSETLVKPAAFTRPITRITVP